MQQSSGQGKSGLPLISKLDSDGDSPRAGCSEDDLNLSDEDGGLGALAFQMNRNSVVGASSGRGL